MRARGYHIDWLSVWAVSLYTVGLMTVFYILYYSAIFELQSGTITQQIQIAREIAAGKEFYPNIFFTARLIIWLRFFRQI